MPLITRINGTRVEIDIRRVKTLRPAGDPNLYYLMINGEGPVLTRTPSRDVTKYIMEGVMYNGSPR